MIINLGDNFESYDFVKVSANGRNIENIKTVEFTFNKEGLIGFAKNLVWLYEDMDVNKKFYVSTDPLGGVPSGNQVIGFYLTADSPILVFPNRKSSGSAKRLFLISCSISTFAFSTTLPSASPSRVLALTSKIWQIPLTRDKSGRPIPLSHLLTA